jgi:hypothetical protein
VTDLPEPSKAPCGTCPYRLDVPSGIWAETEYVKLPEYDGDIGEQAMKGATALFFCHQNDGHLCAGWVGCHGGTNLLATRLHECDPSTYDYVSPVPLFKSGEEACEHGLEDIDDPGEAAQIAIEKLEEMQERNRA